MVASEQYRNIYLHLNINILCVFVCHYSSDYYGKIILQISCGEKYRIMQIKEKI